MLVMKGLRMDCVLRIDVLGEIGVKIDVSRKQILVQEERIEWENEEANEEDIAVREGMLNNVK